MLNTNTPLPPHVLALDDDPSIRALVSDYLTENDLRVTAVASGKELAAVMEREAIDLVVLDLDFDVQNSCIADDIFLLSSMIGSYS